VRRSKVGVTEYNLYDLKKGDKIYEQLAGTVGKVFFESKSDTDPIIFDHIEGMYSYCYLESDPKMVVHISATAKLVKHKDGYKFTEIKLEKETDSGPDKLNNADTA
jgi:hypothetical protein